MPKINYDDETRGKSRIFFVFVKDKKQKQELNLLNLLKSYDVNKSKRIIFGDIDNMDFIASNLVKKAKSDKVQLFPQNKILNVIENVNYFGLIDVVQLSANACIYIPLQTLKDKEICEIFKFKTPPRNIDFIIEISSVKQIKIYLEKVNPFYELFMQIDKSDFVITEQTAAEILTTFFKKKMFIAIMVGMASAENTGKSAFIDLINMEILTQYDEKLKQEFEQEIIKIEATFGKLP